MIHHYKDVTERKAYMRKYGGYQKQPDEILLICPDCGERSYYFRGGEYICKAGHCCTAPGGIYIRYGDWPQVKALIAECNHVAILCNPPALRTPAEWQLVGQGVA